ncbi:MAG TPA: hypothetical protein H9903_02330 [Candidatus Aquabacterium excrementipullorum]|nr:hypothetical protein [Candidatus Aquabacterium excrementipullorum]
MALVIKKWHASTTPNEKGNYVHLIGREAGLFAWFLSVLGLDPTTEVEIKKDLIIFSAASLSGRTTRVIPMKSLTSAFYGYEKPWKEAVLLGLILSPLFFIGLLVGPLYYFLNKTLAIGVVEASGWNGGFAFKRSVIEGQNIDEKQAYKVIDIVRHLIEGHHVA